MQDNILQWFCFTLAILIILGSCTPLDFNDDEYSGSLLIEISASDSVVLSSDPATITVRVENRGGSRIVWGNGSSVCQLHAVVRIEGNEYLASASRVCSDDLVEQGLDPDQSRSESWDWDGHIIRHDELEVLPPGRYQVHGAAGNWVGDSRIEIEIVEPW
jgi:hypothetical protein